MIGHNKYMLFVSLTVLGLLLVSVFVNLKQNMYGVTNPTVDGQLQNAQLFDANVRLSKAHIVTQYRPQALILGTSRAEVGLEPTHPGWQYERVYNLGLPQASIYETKRYFEHALYAGELKQVVLALDFFQFNPELAPLPGFKECRLHTSASRISQFWAKLCDVPALYLSRKAFFSAFVQPNEGHENVYLNDGSRGPLAKEMELVNSGSQHALFLRNEHHYYHDIGFYDGFNQAGASAFRQQAFIDILKLAHEHKIDLRLLVSPSHARQWEVLAAKGLWETFNAWKLFLIETNSDLARAYGNDAFDLWDFADYNKLSQTPPPPLDDSGSRIPWYWESSHYKKELGNIVLDQVLLGKEVKIGRRITKQNWHAWKDEIERRRALYQETERRSLTMMYEAIQSDEAILLHINALKANALNGPTEQT